MQGFVLGAIFAVFLGLMVSLLRTLRARATETRSLAGELAKLAARIEPLERELARTSLRADVAETLLLEKGIADEEDLEEARRYFEQHGQPKYQKDRDGDLH